MAYTKHTWTNGEVITADKLNHIEEGIANKVFIVNVEGTYDGQDNVTWETASATSTEIKEAFDNGILVVAWVTEHIPGEDNINATVALHSIYTSKTFDELCASFLPNDDICIYEDGTVNKQDGGENTY